MLSSLSTLLLVAVENKKKLNKKSLTAFYL